MAHGLKTAEIRHLRHLVCKGGAKVPQIAVQEAGKPVGASLIAKNGGNACGTLLSKVAQRCRKVAQQGGRCSTLKAPPKGWGLRGKWSSPPVRLQGGAR